MDIDGAESTVNGGDDTDAFGQANDGLAYSTFNFDLQILGALTGEIDVGLTGADIQFQAGDVHIGEVELSAASADVDLQFERHGIVNFEVPGIVGFCDEMIVTTSLTDFQLTEPV